MRALVKKSPEPGIWMEDIPIPACGHNDVLIRVSKTSLCGTDIHIYNWDEWAQSTIPVPMAVGHEFCGEVVEIGSEVRGLKPGDRVSGEGHVTCGFCRNCRAGRRHLCPNTVGVGVNRPGCFAEYVVIPALNAFKLPDTIGDDVASMLDPLGNATHCALSFDLVGEDVLITGAGPTGLLAAAIARHVGARHVVITDVNAYRLALAERLDVSRTVDVARVSLGDVVRDLGMTEGFDVGLEMSGNPTALRQLLGSMRNGSRVALLGIPPGEITLDLNQVIFKGLILKGIYGREMFETWYKMTTMLEGGLDVTPVITHRLPAADYARAFEIMKSGESGKVVLDWRA